MGITELTDKAEKDLTSIIDGYEGLGGYNPKTNKYYPYQGKADKKGLKTIGRGHLLSQEEITSGRYKDGLTLAEVNQLFDNDLKVRINRVTTKLNPQTQEHAVAMISSLYNCPSMWEWSNSPRKLYNEHVNRVNLVGSSVRLIQIANYMMMYHNSDGKPQLGLYRRRATEVLYMLTGELLFGNKGHDEEVRLFRRLKQLGVDLKHMSKFKELKGMKL